MRLDWLLDFTNSNTWISMLFLKGSDNKIFQVLWDIQSLFQLLNSAAVEQNDWTWLCSKKILWKQAVGRIWPLQLALAIKNILGSSREIWIRIVHNSVVSRLIFLSVISILWFCRRKSFFIADTCWSYLEGTEAITNSQIVHGGNRYTQKER